MAMKFGMIKKDPKPGMAAVRTKTVKTYKPEEARTGSAKYGKESDTKPAPKFIKDAQAQGKTIVNKGGLNYRAGRNEYDYEYKMNLEKPAVKKDFKQVPMPKPTIMKSKTIETPAPRQQFGKAPMRKRPRVEWLRNKDAKGITNFERKRKKNESGY